VIHGARVLLLAAGRGRRAGGPKAWAPWEGKALLELHLEFFTSLVGADRVSVAIQEEWRPRCEALSPRATWVSADPEAYPIDSLQKLISASPAARSFVLHVDMPVFEAGVYETLWKTEGDAVAPTFGGHRGHPVLLTPKALKEIAGLDPKTDRLDFWLRGHHVIEAPVATDAIHRNLNEMKS
jgi:CTP:molybdopterin cytidylyltransferase MocA